MTTFSITLRKDLSTTYRPTADTRTVACIGDSLSSGEFEAAAEKGSSYPDMYEYSWGQFMARMCGCKVYNMSRGGMTAKEYW